MPDAPKAESTVAPQASNDETVNQPQYVTIDQFNALQKGLNAIAAQMRTAQKPAGEKPMPSAPEEKESLTVREELARLKSELKAKSEREERLQRDSAITRGLQASGLDADSTEIMHAYISQKYGPSIKVDGDRVFYEASQDDVRPIDDLISDVVKAKGERFRPAVATTGNKLKGMAGTTKSSGDYTSLSRDERLKLSPLKAAELLRAQMGR